MSLGDQFSDSKGNKLPVMNSPWIPYLAEGYAAKRRIDDVG